MKLISYNTWKKYNYGHPLVNGYKLCGDDYGYGIFKSVYPKDIAKVIIHEVFSPEEEDQYEFVYWPHPYRGVNSKEDFIDIWCKKIK